MRASWELEIDAPVRQRARRDLALAQLGLEDVITVDLTGGGVEDGCGSGFWCPACRAEARAEALAWLHELSETYPMGPTLHAQ
jgi:hypothetical protein